LPKAPSVIAARAARVHLHFIISNQYFLIVAQQSIIYVGLVKSNPFDEFPILSQQRGTRKYGDDQEAS